MRTLIACVCVSFSLLIFAGCGPDAKSAAAKGARAFETAPAEVKADWQTAMGAIKANDFGLALATLGKLGSQTNLTPQQSQCVRDTSKAMSDLMYDAANKGDAKAKQALEDLRKLNAH